MIQIPLKVKLEMDKDMKIYGMSYAYLLDGKVYRLDPGMVLRLTETKYKTMDAKTLNEANAVAEAIENLTVYLNGISRAEMNEIEGVKFVTAKGSDLYISLKTSSMDDIAKVLTGSFLTTLKGATKDRIKEMEERFKNI